jgi:hypothetical protein
MPLLIGLASTCFASEKGFFGRWEPPTSLQEFWRPINESWWNPDNNSRIYDYCREFAKRSSPDLIGDIISDLKKHPSVVRTSVYSMLITSWDHRKALKILEPYYESTDPDSHKIAEDFIADIEEEQQAN